MAPKLQLGGRPPHRDPAAGLRGGSADRALRTRAASSRSFPASCAARRKTRSARQVKQMLAAWERAISRVAPSRSSRRCATSSRRTWRTRVFRFQGPGPKDWMASLRKPLAESYWVIPGRLLAGKYPGGKNLQELERRRRAAARRGLQRLHRSDRGRRAAALRCLSTRRAWPYVRKPITDHGVPRDAAYMADILATLDDAARARAGACTCIAARASAAPARWWPAT